MHMLLVLIIKYKNYMSYYIKEKDISKEDVDRFIEILEVLTQALTQNK